ncbi:hypothetical protein J2X66_005818 [Pseudomonas sp. 3296]|nr:hypothetical protein [Pseudomonas sp. 3296]
MSQVIEALCATATRWREGNQEHRGVVVLVWQGSVWVEELVA